LPNTTQGDILIRGRRSVVRPIAEAGSQWLQWVQPSLLASVYELRAGDEAFATLRWERALGLLAVAQSAEGTWTFRRRRLPSLRVSAFQGDSAHEIATFQRKPSASEGGALDTASDRRFRWRPTSYWRAEWIWTDAAGAPLIRFKYQFSMLTTRGRIKIEPRAAQLPELSLLVLLGWYLMIVMSEDAMAADLASSG
jgi:hypothetical protein